MNPRKSLIKLAQHLESNWQKVDWHAELIQIRAGWYICEYDLPGKVVQTPRIVIENDNGNSIERRLVGFHSGRNRMLFYLPKGRITAVSKSIEFKQLARVSSVEGRFRVGLICARYLRDFFSLKAFLKVLLIQFQHAFELSSELLKFYLPPDQHGYLHGMQRWIPYRGFGKPLAWWYRQPKIAVLIESNSQRAELLDLLVKPDYIFAVDEVDQLPRDIDYVLPLSQSEHLRFASILVLKKAIKRSRVKPTLVYTDHDYRFDEGAGQHLMAPAFKPEPSLAYLYCFNYIGPALLVARSALSESTLPEILSDEGRYRTALKLMKDTSKVMHISEAVFSSDRQGLLTTPEPNSSTSHWPGINWLRRAEHNALVHDQESLPHQQQPSVDLIIPTRDGLEFLRPCVESLLQKTTYLNFQLYIVDNGSQLEETKVYLQELNANPKITMLDYPGEFNYSAINNFAAQQGSSEYIGLINNDIEVISPDWLSQMMAWAVQPTVGVVGAKLLFSNGQVQHAGVTIGMGNAAGHIHRLEDGEASGYQNRCIATQNMMAVTAACLITPRAVFEKLNGLDEQNLAVAYNDIDFCLRVEASGMEIIWTPEAQLYHHESVSRGDDMSAPHIERYFKELTTFQKRWKTKGYVDKYYSRHLRISDEAVYPAMVSADQDELRLVGSPVASTVGPNE